MKLKLINLGGTESTGHTKVTVTAARSRVEYRCFQLLPGWGMGREWALLYFKWPQGAVGTTKWTFEIQISDSY